MIGFLVSMEAPDADVHRYFRALQRAQRDIDLEPERYKHYLLKALPRVYHDQVDVRGFGAGERLVFEPYTQEMYERTHHWVAAWRLFRQPRPVMPIMPQRYWCSRPLTGVRSLWVEERGGACSQRSGDWPVASTGEELTQ